jgi:hypothetical protein
MESYQTWFGEGPELSLLHILGIFDRQADQKAIGALLKPPAIHGLTESLTDLSQAEWRTILAKLRRARLLAGEDPHNLGQLDDVSSFPDPNRTELQADLRKYVRQVIDVAWPQQKRGIVPEDEGVTLSTLQPHLSRFEPATEGQKVIYAEAYRGFNMIAELRSVPDCWRSRYRRDGMLGLQRMIPNRSHRRLPYSFRNVWRGVFPGTFLERSHRFRSTWASHTSCYCRCALARVYAAFGS